MTKVLVLLSGGIDSPVSAYLMAKAGAEVCLLHMDNGSYGDPKDLEKVNMLAQRLREETGKEMPLYIANHENSQQVIGKKCETGYRCVMCKRVMHHVAMEFCKREGINAIVMGDSLGQVASQTLKNIRAEQHNLNYPILRPLIGLDKEEIINIAKRIGTYDISIIQTKGCAAVPAKPITEASPSKVSEQSDAMDFHNVVNMAVNSIYQ